MECLGVMEDEKLFLCPRCGTIRHWGQTHVPKLVERCRQFEKNPDVHLPKLGVWHRLGIAESINLLGDRPGDASAKLEEQRQRSLSELAKMPTFACPYCDKKFVFGHGVTETPQHDCGSGPCPGSGEIAIRLNKETPS
jgi:endogenous inhibitor of DNA gyrase (YacG/DUF329 family)